MGPAVGSVPGSRRYRSWAMIWYATGPHRRQSRAGNAFFSDSARGTRRRNRWPGGAAIDVCAAGPELANEVRGPYQPGGHECFANGRLSYSPSRPPRLVRLDFPLNQGPLRASFARGARSRAALAPGGVRGPVRGRLYRCARPWGPLERTWRSGACPRGAPQGPRRRFDAPRWVRSLRV